MCFMIAVLPSADSQSASPTPAVLAEAPVEIAFGRDAPSYKLERCNGNLVVARRHSRARRQVVHYALFREESTFLDWCAADDIRLSHPLLHRELTRAGSALLGRCAE